jgi:hypothetical protein
MAGELKKMKPRAVPANSAEQRLRAVAIVMVLCLLMVIGIVVVMGPGKSNKRGITAQTSEPASSAAQSSTSSSGIESVLVPPLSVYRRRNIFKPLMKTDYSDVSAPSAAAAPTTSGTAGGAATGSARVITLPPELDVTGTQAGTVVSTALTLEGVFEQDGKMYARISVGDNLFEKVAVGEVFASYYKLLALGKDSSASILYGDERFSIYTGQSLYW